MDLRVDYDRHQHAVCERGRRPSPAIAALWRRTFAKYVRPRSRILDLVPWLEYFQAARPIAERQALARAELVAMFAGQAFDHIVTEQIKQENAPSLRFFYERVQVRAISTLELISDEQFEAGIERMRRVAEQEEDPRLCLSRSA